VIIRKKLLNIMGPAPFEVDFTSLNQVVEIRPAVVALQELEGTSFRGSTGARRCRFELLLDDLKPWAWAYLPGGSTRSLDILPLVYYRVLTNLFLLSDH